METYDFQQSDYVLRDLNATAKWGILLSFIGFTFSGVYFIIAVYAARFIQITFDFPVWLNPYIPVIKSVFMLIPGIVYLIPNLLYYKILHSTLTALSEEEVGLLPNEIIRHHRIIEQLGTLMIVALAFISVVIIRLLLSCS